MVDTNTEVVLGTIYRELIALMAKDQIAYKYSLSQAVDEYLAYMSGDSAASTYLGFSVETGTSLVSELEGIKEKLKAIIDAMED